MSRGSKQRTRRRRNRHESRRERIIKILLLGVAAVVTVGLSAFALNSSPPTSTYVASTSVATDSGAAAPDSIEPINAPAGTKTLVFGDSWTAGYAAAPSDHGYAYLLGAAMGWDNTVVGVAGTGYVNAGPGQEGTYSDRIAALSSDLNPGLIIVQGGLNDAYLDRALILAAAADAIATLKAKYPGAALVILGPAPSSLPVSEELTQVDGYLRTAAQRAHLHYVSPIAQGWITPANYSDVIDVAAMKHPSTIGHAFLADRARQAIIALQ